MSSIDERILALENRVDDLEKQLVGRKLKDEKSQPKRQSAKEFLMQKKVGGFKEMTLVLAYYYEVLSANGPFDVSVLEKLYEAAKVRKPANLNDQVNQNVKAGFMMESPKEDSDRKHWVLTVTGEKHVEAL